MRCTCTTHILTVFIQRVTCLDVNLLVQRTVPRKYFHSAKYQIRTQQRRQFQSSKYVRSSAATHYPDPQVSIIGTSLQNKSASGILETWHLKTTRSQIPDMNVNAIHDSRQKSLYRRDDSEFQKSSSMANGDMAEVASSKNSCSQFPKKTYQYDIGAAVLELTPEMIDTLATSHLQKVYQRAISTTGFVQDKIPRGSKIISNVSASETRSSRSASFRANREVQRLSRLPKAIKYKPDYPFGERESWQVQKAALKEKFKGGWNPRKKLSPDALAGIRAIHMQFPEQYPTSALAEKFEVSAEAIRRILKSKWTPKEEEELDRQRRWFSRGVKVWGRYAELGLKPPARWRKLGIGRKGLSTQNQQAQLRVDTNVTVRRTGDETRHFEDEIRVDSMAGRIL